MKNNHLIAETIMVDRITEIKMVEMAETTMNKAYNGEEDNGAKITTRGSTVESCWVSMEPLMPSGGKK